LLYHVLNFLHTSCIVLYRHYESGLHNMMSFRNNP